ncbi:hypothetical protein [Clostridium cylindrosporum]|uniref:DUF1292 domain-containing protein n=1 Tax=Clostridium cylindrosporum DSM 605 TaxID=1121307 RepID=A0A0J8DER2_CLOCY|nr:hypothetical protein [Clostridium cylindrosporum]KMT22719.1 hypothetical protein CLCY_11c00530 [Clostridium cylindrosporum DSM 605]
MGRAKDFIEKEKDQLGSLLYNINGAIAEIAPFIEEETLRNRKYFSRVDAANELLKYLEDKYYEENKDGILGFLNDGKRIAEVENKKNKYSLPISQLENCSKCKCLSCTKTCSFDSCSGCREDAFVKECNKESFNTVFYNDFILNLTRDGEGSSRYNVLATLQDLNRDQKYIIIQEIATGEKFILHYYPGISESDYGEITDKEEFDFIVNEFEKIR